MSDEDMYREHILDLYRHPHNRGSIKNPTHQHRAFNPVCGDDITITLIVSKNTITDIAFDGTGCAICLAAASLMTDAVKGKSLADALRLGTQDVLALIAIPLSPVRLKCALLPLEAVHTALRRTP